MDAPREAPEEPSEGEGLQDLEATDEETEEVAGGGKVTMQDFH